MRRTASEGVAYAFWAYAESLRNEQNLTITEMCKRANDMRRQTYMALQYTTRRPQREIVLAVAGVLGMDLDKAFGLAKLKPMDSDIVRLAILNANDLEPEHKDALLSLLDGYEHPDEQHRTPLPAPTPVVPRPRTSTATVVPLFQSAVA